MNFNNAEKQVIRVNTHQILLIKILLALPMNWH